jgi:hypothetical protein
MSRADELRAELALIELEEKLVDAKKAKAFTDVDDEQLRELKDEVRTARRAYREAREGVED